jgi:hypothetical protein
MNHSVSRQGKASPGFVEQVERYVHRCLTSLQAKQERQGAGPDPKGAGRPIKLPSVALWTGLLMCILNRVSGVRDVWRYLVQQGYDICDQTLYDRLDQEGTAWLEQFFVQISAMLAAWLQPRLQQQPWYPLASFATDVLVLDETTLDPVARLLPILRHLKKGAVELLPGKLAGLYDVRLQLWRRIDYLPDALQNCKVHARSMLEGLATGTLLLFDLGYFGFEWLDELSSLKYWYICRLREKTSYTVTHIYVQTEAVFDGLVWLGTHHARARYAVRLVRFQVGNLMLEYLTNVLEPTALPVQEMARLYGRRWDIELAFLLLKEALGLHLWWNSKVSGILQQVWAALIIAQLLQAVRLEIACLAHVDPFEVSMPLVVSALPQLLARGEDPISFCVRRGRQLGFIRPSSRIKVQAPPVAIEALVKRPATLELQREPRYPAAPGVAGRKAYNAKKKKKRPPAMLARLTTEQYACLAQ